ncbi:phospholipase D-like domain-containing protein [Helicobacter sp.]|uniref:phospholipase D-like domain-containing protein n=1 Tax=Helicobacter sp. TaxID=218 RepID=UPI0025C37E26|nr:phospholipase D-like domain-containing protein [Helicobacter sp.]MCI5969334.1 phospholipase D-like domain-containing protein [Helicobacter sp.]MDY2585588.1 phospholipase D-like domain-containing protein [Helicobacter sp.]
MFKKVFILFCFNILCLNHLLASDLYFMPKEQKRALDALLQTIKNTQNTLDIAIYSFTNREISKAIRDAAKKGVKVRIVYDKKSNQDPNKSTIGYLAKLKNIETCLLEGERSQNGKYNGLMHIKMAISDNKHLILGSANWSKSAFETNYETLLILDDVKLITQSHNTFEEMFKQCEKY